MSRYDDGFEYRPFKLFPRWVRVVGWLLALGVTAGMAAATIIVVPLLGEHFMQVLESIGL